MIRLAKLVALLSLALLAGCETVRETPTTEIDAKQWLTAKAEIYRELAMRSLRGGDPDRTRRLLAEAVQFEGGDVRSLQLLARLSLVSGELVEAKSYARWWLKLEPESIPALCLNGIVDESLGNHAEAEAFFRQAATIDAEDPWPLIDLHTFLLNRGKETEATAVRELTMRKFPDCSEVLIDHGSYLESQGHWMEALVVFQEARELQPEDLDLAVRVGTAALLAGQDQVLLELEDHLPPRTRLEDASLALLLAAMRLRTGDDEAALGELDLLQGSAREDPVVWLLRGEILLSRQDLTGAEAAFRETLHRDERIARAHGGLARVYLARKQQDAAGRSLQRAVELDPRNAVNRALLAACLAQACDFARASEHLEVARRSGNAPLLVHEIERRFPQLEPQRSKREEP